MQVSEQEVLTIYEKGYGVPTSLYGALFQAHRDFFQSKIHKVEGRISSHEDGMQVQVHYAVSPGDFVWEKHSDHHLAEQASSIPNGQALSFYSGNGGTCSRTEYDKEHHLQYVEYYALDSEVQESFSMIAEHFGELVWAHR